MRQIKIKEENNMLVLSTLELDSYMYLNKSAIETIKNSTNIDYWDRMDIVQQLSDK